ncbi:MAG: TM0106 family RecB-like putative nuclease [Nitrospirales bacterium]
MVYLFGYVICEPGRPAWYDYLWAERPEDEEQTVRAFWTFVQSCGNVVFYVYSHKERTTLKQLMERYGLDGETFEIYKAKEYDLYQQLIVDYSDWPTFSYGIKHVAKWIGFQWRDLDPSGANSIAWYNEYLNDPANPRLRQRIVDYNEDDCYAMLAIKRYFEHHRPNE